MSRRLTDASASIDPSPGINVTPLVDVALVLLIIFMVTAKMAASRALPLDLPRGSPSQEIQLIVGTMSPEKLLRRLTPEQRLQGLTPEQLREQLTPEQRLQGLTPEQRLQGLTPEQLAATIDALPAEIREQVKRHLH